MTPFIRSVYTVVAAIPSGRVTSYGAVAAILGHRPAVRAGPSAPPAVGGPLSAIPNELDLPWWRVINSSGRIDWDRYEWDPKDAELEQILRTVDA